MSVKVATRSYNAPSSAWDEVAGSLRAVPGVEAVAYADWALLDGYSFKTDAISVQNLPPGETAAWFLNVSPGWFATMGIPLLDGRDFRSSDLSPGTAIVNDTFAKLYFNGERPIGKWFEGNTGYMRGQRFRLLVLFAMLDTAICESPFCH